MELKKSDPGCQLTSWALRGLVRDGVIPAIRIGSKALLSVEAVERYVDEELRSNRLS